MRTGGWWRHRFRTYDGGRYRLCLGGLCRKVTGDLLLAGLELIEARAKLRNLLAHGREIAGHCLQRLRVCRGGRGRGRSATATTGCGGDAGSPRMAGRGIYGN